MPPDMSPELFSAIIIGTGTLAWVGYYLLRIGRRESDLPPGPPTFPLLGNIANFPKEYFFIPFTQWSREYGDVYSLKIGSGTIIVLNSVESIRELLLKQSNRTSDRPPSVVSEVVTGGLHMAILSPGPEWRAYHRATKEILSPAACARHSRILAAEATQLSYDLLLTPEDFFAHIERFTSSIILSIIAGRRAPRRSSPYVQEFYRVLFDWTAMLESGAILDFIPLMRYFPPWSTKMAKVKKWQNDLYLSLVADSEAREARGTSNGCELDKVRANADDWGLTRQMVGYLGGVLAEAGSDTTAIYIKNLILLLMAFPEVQLKAQAEVDAMLSPDRAPVLEDLKRLPYVAAVIKEVHRFRPVDPLAFPRAASEDAWCEGYRIPKGSVIFTNVWGILHDDRLYDDPDKFNPERYIEHPLGLGKVKRGEYDALGDNNVDSPLRLLSLDNGMLWGTGKRLCPGMHLAQMSLKVTTMNLLWAFTFSNPVDTNGKEIKPNTFNILPGIVSAPRPFKCTIRPRSPSMASIIHQDFHGTASAFEPFEQELDEAERAWLSASRNGSTSHL